MSTSPYYNKIQVDVKFDNLEQQIANVADGTAGKAYPNLTTAMAVTPLPDNGVIFTIDEDNETEAGVYAYDSNEVNGYRFVRELGAKGVVEEGNTQAVSGGEVFESLEPIKQDLNSIIDKSLNLLNFETFEGATYAISSTTNKVTKSSTNNWISAVVNDISPNTNYYLQGLGTITNDAVRVVIFADENDNALGSITKGDFTGLISTPSNTRKLFLRLANGTNIGLNPTENVIKNTAMLSLGVTSKDFQPYGKDEIILPDNILYKEDIDIVGSINLIDKTKILSGTYGATGGATANANRIRYEYTNTNSNTKILSGIGSLTISQIRYVEQDEDNNVLNIVYGDGTANDILINPSPATTKIKINLANVVDIGLNPTDNAIANAVMLEEKSLLPASDYEPYGTLIPIEKIKGVQNQLYDVYVSYNPTGYQSMEEIIFYVRRGQSNFYVGFHVRHEVDTSEIVYSNQFRINRAYEYKLINGGFIKVGDDVIFGGESECVYMNTIGGKVDFTGGVHGDEQLISWDFLIDGVVQDKNTAFTMKPCKTASYVQKSTMHETADSGGVVVENHPIQAIHYKNTIFGNGGYETHNALEWKVSIPFYWYHGIACIGKFSATEAYPESLIKTPMTGSLDTFFNLTATEAQTQGATNGWSADKILQKTLMKKARKVEYWNSANNKGAVVSAWLDSDYLKDDETLLFVHDRANDSKYYRRTLETNSVIGAIDRSVMKVTFK